MDISKRVFICRQCSPSLEKGDAIYWCRKCNDTTKHEHKREKLKGGEGHIQPTKEESTPDDKKRFLDNLFEDYHNLDYEDVIAGGTIKTRFKYTNVPKADFGLTEEEILLLDDNKLNSLVSLKHYRPYRHVKVENGEVPDERDFKNKSVVNVHAVIARKKEFKKEVTERLDLAKQLAVASHEAEKAQQLASLGGKLNKHKDKSSKLLKKRDRKEARKDRKHEESRNEEVDDAEAKKRKRLALYGI